MIRIPRNSRRGKRCFVIASGPSVGEMDLSGLRNEITICVNESYRALDFDPTYICIGDRALWPLVKDKYATMKSHVICSTGTQGNVGSEYTGKNMKIRAEMNNKKQVLDEGFSWDLRTGVNKAYNVIPEIVLPFVCWAGFQDVYLIGCDCTNNGYFYDDSIRFGNKQNIDALATESYDIISKTPDIPTRIWNAGIGGNLNCFPRVQYVDALDGRLQLKDLLVIGYYTPNNDYKELATSMMKSVEAQGLSCMIKERTTSKYIKPDMKKPMPWVLNCAQCGQFINDMMMKYRNEYKAFLYLDADAVMVRFPELFFESYIDYDIAAPFLTNKYVKNELVSNTLFFNNTFHGRSISKAWATEQELRINAMLRNKYKKPYREVWDQKVLQDTIDGKDLFTPVVKTLPGEYAKITLTPKGEELMPWVDHDKIVIEQYQASRHNKFKV